MERAITKQSEDLRAALNKIAESRADLGHIGSLCQPLLPCGRYLTGEQVRMQFSICKKTLQTYRDTGVIAHTSIGGKFLYKESDILEILNDNYRLARKPFGAE